MVLVLAGCSNPMSPRQLVGSWDEAFNIPGSFRHMMLDTSTASELFGGGNFCGEAGPCGTFTVSGSTDGDAVHLQFSYSDGTTDQFDGVLINPATLKGVETSKTPGSPARNVTFQRVRTVIVPG
jgi:hypothetical protein